MHKESQLSALHVCVVPGHMLQAAGQAGTCMHMIFSVASPMHAMLEPLSACSHTCGARGVHDGGRVILLGRHCLSWLVRSKLVECCPLVHFDALQQLSAQLKTITGITAQKENQIGLNCRIRAALKPMHGCSLNIACSNARHATPFPCVDD